MKYAKVLLLALFCVLFSGIAEANTLWDRPPTIFYPEGHYLEGWPRKPFRDMFGYNYQRHQFTGLFANVYLGGDGLPPYGGNTERYLNALTMYGYFGSVEEAEEYFSGEWFWGLRDVRLWMYWNDAWLSNQDRGDDNMGTEPDGNLDRHYGYPSYIDSGAKLEQYQIEPIKILCKGRIKTVYLFYYSKIVAARSTDELIDGIWYDEDGNELGPVSYGQFVKVKEFLYDPLENEDPCKSICLKPRKWKKELCERVRPAPNHKKGLCWKRVERPDNGDNGKGRKQGRRR